MVNAHGLRGDILTLIGAFPGIGVAHVTRFFRADASSYVDRLLLDGLLVSRPSPAGQPGRPYTMLYVAGSAARTVTVPDDLAAEQDAAAAKVLLGLRRISAEAERPSVSDAARRHAGAAQAMARVLFAAPHRYVREVALADVAERAGVEGRLAMRGARLLEREGLVDLFERKGAGRTTTVQIRVPLPYPMV